MRLRGAWVRAGVERGPDTIRVSISCPCRSAPFSLSLQPLFLFPGPRGRKWRRPLRLS